jgi:glutathione S-transferase
LQLFYIASTNVTSSRSQDKLVRGFFNLLAAQDEGEQEALKEKLLHNLREWTAAAAEIQSSPASGPFFMGEHFGSVDIAFLPFAVRYKKLNHV